jgi:hypothetical protein
MTDTGANTVFPEDALLVLLTKDQDVASIIADRMFPLVAPHGKPRPYIIWRRGESPPEHDLSNPSHPSGNTVAGLRSYNFWLNAVAEKYGDMRRLSEAIRRAIDGLLGTRGKIMTPQGDFIFSAITFLGEEDHYIDPIGGQDTGAFGSMMHFLTHAPETIPSK